MNDIRVVPLYRADEHPVLLTGAKAQAWHVCTAPASGSRTASA